MWTFLPSEYIQRSTVQAVQYRNKKRSVCIVVGGPASLLEMFFFGHYPQHAFSDDSGSPE